MDTSGGTGTSEELAPELSPESMSKENSENIPRHEKSSSGKRRKVRSPGPPRYESKTRLKVRIKKWNAVATWKWIANEDTCGICRMPFDACCADCKMPGDDCPLVWGQCSHCFHMHCIMKWLNSNTVQQHCPMCRQEWKFKDA